MKVSVLMPVYNHTAYLRRAIESIANQTYENVELLIWDDGSTEDVYGVVRSCKSAPIGYWRSNENLGLTVCLNKLLDRATGDFFARQDSDDWSDPSRIAEQVKLWQPGVGLVTTYAWAVDSHNRRMANTYLDDIAQPKHLNDLHRHNVLVDATALIPRDVFARIGYYDERLYIGQSYNYHMRIARAGYTIRVVPHALYCVRKHPLQVRHRKRGQLTLDGERCNAACRKWAKMNTIITLPLHRQYRASERTN